MLTVKVFHGTTKTFKRLSIRRGFGLAGFAGAGIYFTDNVRDAVTNYASPNGADLKSKIEHFTDKKTESWSQRGTVYNRIKKHFVRTRRLITAEITFKKPFNLFGAQKQWIGGNYSRFPMFKRISDYVDSLRKDGNIDCSIDDDFLDTFRMMMFEGTTTENLWDYCNGQQVHHDGAGVPMNGEFARRIVELLGFDGIVQNDTLKKWFYLMRDVGNATHYIAFRRKQVNIISDAILL